MDSVEKAPTSRAKCKKCMNQIQRDTWRICLNSNQYAGKKYYHKECFLKEKSLLKQLNIPPPPRSSSSTKRKIGDISMEGIIQNEIETYEKTIRKKEHIVHQERGKFREHLRKLRTATASKLGVPAYFVFDNSVLDAIVEQLPSNKNEFLQIKGLGPKKYENYGTTFIKEVIQYKVQNSPRSSNSSSSSKKQKVKDDEIIVIECDESDDEIIVAKELSVDDIVTKRLQEAAESGNIIEL